MSNSSHKDLAKATTKTTKLTTIFNNPVADKVTKAEVLFTSFIAEHNLPFLVADHFTQLCKVMFTDSEIAQKFNCR